MSASRTQPSDLSAGSARIACFDPFAGPPRINGARRVGIRAGTELIHPLAVTGERPLRFEVDGLPDGIVVDDDGILRGHAPEDDGAHDVQVRVSNSHGTAAATVRICVGPLLALTPPMGWNSWNVYGDRVSAEVIVRIAEEMVANGMRDLGYQYVNIDDFWHAASRAEDGTPVANPDTFPDGIAPVADALHRLGLKLGIYSDAAHLTCGKCFGGLGYERVDARTYAEWGVDLLKYDYCHAPKDRGTAEERYGAMSRALQATDRSIVLSACEWGGRQPWRWAAGLGASSWRTTLDIFDSFSWFVFGVRGIARRNLRLADHAGPGAWNDPDMLVIGNRGRGRVTSRLAVLPKGVLKVPLRGLNDLQSVSHMTLWVMMAAPLLASHDLAAGSPLDMALLTNPDVLAINQDVLGAQCRKVAAPPGIWQLVKPLADGGVAVSVTNVSPLARTVEVDLAALAGAAPPGGWRAIDAWSGDEVDLSGPRSVRLARHQSALFVVRPAD